MLLIRTCSRTRSVDNPAQCLLLLLTTWSLLSNSDACQDEYLSAQTFSEPADLVYKLWPDAARKGNVSLCASRCSVHTPNLSALRIFFNGHHFDYTPSQWGNYTTIACSITPLPPWIYFPSENSIWRSAAVTHNLIGRKIISNVKHSDARNSLPILDVIRSSDKRHSASKYCKWTLRQTTGVCYTRIYVLGAPSHFRTEYRHETAVVSREHRMKWVVVLGDGYQWPLPWECTFRYIQAKVVQLSDSSWYPNLSIFSFTATTHSV